MKEVIIYVEGVNDRVFLVDYLQKVFQAIIEIPNQGDRENKKRYNFKIPAHCQGNIQIIGGWTFLKESLYQRLFKRYAEEGKQVLVLLDADFPMLQDQGGFMERDGVVKAIQAQFPFEYFLIPNGQDDGYLETLLEKIVTTGCRPVLQCIQDKNACLEQTTNTLPTGVNLKLHPQKSAVKAEINHFRRLLGNDHNEGFQNPNIWNLQHPYLQPLHDFLTQYLL